MRYQIFLHYIQFSSFALYTPVDAAELNSTVVDRGNHALLSDHVYNFCPTKLKRPAVYLTW